MQELKELIQHLWFDCDRGSEEMLEFSSRILVQYEKVWLADLIRTMTDQFNGCKIERG